MVDYNHNNINRREKKKGEIDEEVEAKRDTNKPRISVCVRPKRTLKKGQCRSDFNPII